MKIAIVVLIVVLLGAAALLIAFTVRWLGLVLESHRWRARHCGRGGAVSIGDASTGNEGPCIRCRCNGDGADASADPTNEPLPK